jgi:hypothetical protein
MMKRIILSILPFFGMLILATGSVLFSCATSPEYRDEETVRINTATNTKGKMYTTWVFDEIHSVVAASTVDRSNKVELNQGEWVYAPETTELTITSELPFLDYVASVEGRVCIPHSFVLTEMIDPSSIMVVLDGRLAIEGYDYTFDAADNLLVLRDDIRLNNTGWMVRYFTTSGSASIGDWEPENRDQLSYIEAEFQQRYLDALYEKQETFWFFSDPDEPGDRPSTVQRKATPDELEAMKSYPAIVWKYRGDRDFRSLSKEVGYPVSLPESIRLQEDSGVWSIRFKTIAEINIDGEIVRKLHVHYGAGDRNSRERPEIEVILAPSGTNSLDEDAEYPIKKDIVDLGIPVQRIRYWAMVSEGNIDAKPEVVSTTTWIWTSGPTEYRMTTESSKVAEYQSIIKALITETRK